MQLETLKVIQVVMHYGLHFIFPVAVALVFFRQQWRKAYLLMLLTMLVDLDHLLSTPVFNPNRPSIGTHLLHTWPAIFFYGILFCFPKTRIIAIGLLLHMLTDFMDGLWMTYINGYTNVICVADQILQR